MKVTATRVVEQTEVTSILCNKCGEEMITKCSPGGNGVSVTYQAGFDAKLYKDGDNVEFDICEKCLKAFTKSFKVPPKIENYMREY